MFGSPDLAFVVEGDPVGKQRPRSDRRSGRMYTPKPTVVYERAVREAADAAVARAIRETGELWTKSGEWFVLVEAWSPTAATPDADNVFKSVVDAMQGVVLENDRRVGGAFPPVRVDRLRPRTEVRVWRASEMNPSTDPLAALDVARALDAAGELLKAHRQRAPLALALGRLYHLLRRVES